MDAVFGQRDAMARFERAIAADDLAHAYLLTGPEGIGKTTLALAVARALVCLERAPGSGRACAACAACRKVVHGNHPDVLVIQPAADRRNLGVDVVRDLLRVANLAPSEAPWRVFILPAVERMTPEAANALLKTLEEPPPRVVLLLTSAEPENLLSTLLSRCQVVPMQPLAPAVVAQALRERWDVAPAEATRLAALANGRLGWAVRALAEPDLERQRADLLEQLVALTGMPREDRLRQAGALADDTQAARRAVELWLLWWRDVVLAAVGATHLTTTGAARAAAEQHGRALGGAAAMSFLQALVGALAALDQNANPRLTLEVLLLDLP